MRKTLSAVLCLIMFFAGLLSAASGDTLAISLNPTAWFGKTVEEAGSALESIGYKANSDNKTGLFKNITWKYENEKLSPKTVNVWFDSDTHMVNWIALVFSKDPALFEQLYQSMNLLYGEPKLTEQREDVQQWTTVTYPEAYVWTGETVKYNMASTNRADDSVGTFKDVLAGKTGFSIRMFQQEAEEKQTPLPTATPRPTATPKPVKVEISIDSVEIKDTRYGTREFYIRFKNNASVTVDRIDFRIQGYNRYGERIVQHRIDAVDFYYDEVIKPGKLSPKNYYYNYYMLNEATKIKIAILKYHTTDGRTVEVPEYQLKWSTFEK